MLFLVWGSKLTFFLCGVENGLDFLFGSKLAWFSEGANLTWF